MTKETSERFLKNNLATDINSLKINLLSSGNKKILNNRRSTFADTGSLQKSSSALPSKESVTKSDVLIQLDNDTGVYTAGDVISGQINIVLTQDIRIKELLVRIYGMSRVSWHEKRTYTKGSAPRVSLKNNELFLDNTLTLFNRETETESGEVEGATLQMGSYWYPFEYRLPSELPFTFSGKWGYIKYGIKAVLRRPWRFDVEREKEITINAKSDLNDEPELARPVGILGEFSPGFLCIRRGTVSVEMRVARRGYAPGEDIPFYVEVENNSRNTLHEVKVALMQQVLYRARKKVRKSVSCLTSLVRGSILPGVKDIWTTGSLQIPNTFPSSCRILSNMQFKYTVTLSIGYSSWTNEYRLPLTITIGTVALRRQTINTYLMMLGFRSSTESSSSTAVRKDTAADKNNDLEQSESIISSSLP